MEEEQVTGTKWSSGRKMRCSRGLRIGGSRQLETGSLLPGVLRERGAVEANGVRAAAESRAGTVRSSATPAVWRSQVRQRCSKHASTLRSITDEPSTTRAYRRQYTRVTDHLYSQRLPLCICIRKGAALDCLGR